MARHSADPRRTALGDLRSLTCTLTQDTQDVTPAGVSPGPGESGCTASTGAAMQHGARCRMHKHWLLISGQAVRGIANPAAHRVATAEPGARFCAGGACSPLNLWLGTCFAFHCTADAVPLRTRQDPDGRRQWQRLESSRVTDRLTLVSRSVWIALRVSAQRYSHASVRTFALPRHTRLSFASRLRSPLGPHSAHLSLQLCARLHRGIPLTGHKRSTFVRLRLRPAVSWERVARVQRPSSARPIADGDKHAHLRRRRRLRSLRHCVLTESSRRPCAPRRRRPTRPRCIGTAGVSVSPPLGS